MSQTLRESVWTDALPMDVTNGVPLSPLVSRRVVDFRGVAELRSNHSERSDEKNKQVALAQS